MDNIALGYETILNTNVGLNWELVEDLVAPIGEELDRATLQLETAPAKKWMEWQPSADRVWAPVGEDPVGGIAEKGGAQQGRPHHLAPHHLDENRTQT